jgi:hypothetical protein
VSLLLLHGCRACKLLLLLSLLLLLLLLVHGDRCWQWHMLLA